MKRYALIGAAVVVALGALAFFAFSGGNSKPLAGSASSSALASNPLQALTPSDKAPSDKPFDRPLWRELTPLQQRALEPLAAEWNPLDTLHKRKWLQLSEKFAAMKPDEQARFHERMRDWVKLSPEQRRLARENFWRAKTLAPDQKSAQWLQYQQLPEDQKKKLAADNAGKKQVANLPSALSDKDKPPPRTAIVKPFKSPHTITLRPQTAAATPALITPVPALPALPAMPGAMPAPVPAAGTVPPAPASAQPAAAPAPAPVTPAPASVPAVVK